MRNIVQHDADLLVLLEEQDDDHDDRDDAGAVGEELDEVLHLERLPFGEHLVQFLERRVPLVDPLVRPEQALEGLDRVGLEQLLELRDPLLRSFSLRSASSCSALVRSSTSAWSWSLIWCTYSRRGELHQVADERPAACTR